MDKVWGNEGRAAEAAQPTFYVVFPTIWFLSVLWASSWGDRIVNIIFGWAAYGIPGGLLAAVVVYLIAGLYASSESRSKLEEAAAINADIDKRIDGIRMETSALRQKISAAGHRLSQINVDSNRALHMKVIGLRAVPQQPWERLS